jgi:hypothetical protein
MYRRVRRLASCLLALCFTACSSGDDDDGPPADSGTPDLGTPDAGDTSVCETWFVTYDLMPAQFDIRGTPFGAGDSTEDVGPGTLRLRFDDDGGDLAEGPAALVELDLALNFDVMDVFTDIDVTAGPNECGVADGTYDGETIQWTTPVRGYHAMGTVTCMASEIVCGFANLPVGEASPRDRTSDQPFMPFIFTSSTSTVIPPNGFIMDYVEIPNDDAGDTFLRFTGRETDRICVREPDCP